MGFEVKVSRPDWLKELKDPSKADAICRYCDRWYLVAASAAIVKAGELPDTWGLIIPHGDGLKVAIEAKQLAPKPFDRGFVAAIMRRACEQSVDKTVVEAAYRRGREEANKDAERREARQFEDLRKKVAELERDRVEFETKVGVSMQWRWGNDSEAELFRKLRPLIENEGRLSSHLVRIRNEAETVLKLIDRIGPVESVQDVEGDNADE